jgi:hypothetical protein
MSGRGHCPSHFCLQIGVLGTLGAAFCGRIYPVRAIKATPRPGEKLKNSLKMACYTGFVVF